MSKTLLVVDDNEDMRSVLAYQLTARGYQVIMATNGQEGIDKALAEKPDLILLDILMPVMDGTEAAAQLKEDPRTKNIPILFLTSLVQGENVIRAEEAKDQFTLPKSISMEKLVYEIELALSRK